MTAATCDLCELPTPDPPVTDEAVEGAFCCRGCLEVTRQLGSVGEASGRDAREALGAETEGNLEGTETAFLAVDGMHCATCEAYVEGRATRAEGVVSASANYAAEVLKVDYDPDRIEEDALPGIVGGLGYAARGIEDRPDRRDGPPWRLLVGGLLAMPVMAWYLVFLYPRYLGLAPSSPAWSVGPTSTASLANLLVFAAGVLLVTGYPILRGAYVSLRAGRPNMDLLVALAAVNAYAYSALVVFSGGTEVYVDVTVVIVLVVTLGNYYEDRIKRRAAGLLSDLTAAGVDQARRRTPGGTETVGVDGLEPGEEVLVKAGERVPVDGTVVEGEAAVDESLVTGESTPVRKTPGDPAVGGAVVADGALVVEVGEGAESTIDRLVGLLWEVQSARPGVGRLADRIAAVFVPLVLAAAAAAFGWRFLAGGTFSSALLTGLAVLVVSCPCALGLATPLAVASGVREGLERDVAVTDASAFETAADVDVVAFDKTGTLTTGEMRVVDPGSERAMELAAAAEAYSEHPIAEAIAARADPPDASTSAFERHPGRGVSATVDGEHVTVGSPDLLAERGLPVPERLAERVEAARAEGNVPVLVGWDGRARSVVVVGDRPREGWAEVVDDLAGRGHEVAVVTGDSEAATARFRDHPSIGRVFAGVPPEAKAGAVERLRAEGTVAMVGDGTNDAPALAAADLGIAMGQGTAVATDAAGIVVTGGDLRGVPTAFDVVREANSRVRGNLAWAFLYNAVAIPAAAAGFLTPLVAAVAMATSSLLVVGNSARPFRRREREPRTLGERRRRGGRPGDRDVK